jgi:peptidoglycan DL-endopeptidase CwlO
VPVSTRTALSRARTFIAAAAVLTAVVVVAPSVASAKPRHPKPTVHSVQATLDKLARQAESLTEQFNATRVEIARQGHALASARRAARVAGAQFRAMRADFVVHAVAQYENGTMDSFGILLASDDPAAAIENVATQEMMAQHSADILGQVNDAWNRAVAARGAAIQLLRQTRETRQQLAEQRIAVLERTAKYQQLLARLTAPQLTAYVSSGTPDHAQLRSALDTPAPSNAAAKAVQFAIEQIGKPYVWGASGPDSYDCSGLTMAAWAHAGVSLPHYSAAQYGYGRHVSYNELQPGDLIFLYGDLHHVEIYIGAGVAISAPQEGEPVKYVLVAYHRSDFYGATRLG